MLMKRSDQRIGDCTDWVRVIFGCPKVQLVLRNKPPNGTLPLYNLERCPSITFCHPSHPSKLNDGLRVEGCRPDVCLHLLNGFND